MSLKTQAKILRVLQEQHFERVGGNKTIHVDVRVIAASNKRLEDEIAAGTFREDLYYRLNVLQLEVPPLRERAGDVELLVPYFIEFFSAIHGHKPKQILPEALEVLKKYRWPGNVRELKNIVERMMIMVTGPKISRENIPPAILNAVSEAEGSEDGGGGIDPGRFQGSFREAREAFERSWLKLRLEDNSWNVSKTAEAIKLERSNLHKKIKQLNIEAG
jgi:two-component system nitrogen regulation response regulator NtrX